VSSPTDTPSFDQQQGDTGYTQAVQGQGDFFRTLLAPLKVRDFRLLFGGQMISTLGDMFYAVALPWLMLSSGRTAQELGMVLAAYGVPRVAALLVGGILSDRIGPRWVMLLADGARAALVGILAVLVMGGYTGVWQLCAVTIPLGAFTGLFLPAYYAMLPEALSDEQLQAGNALNSSSIQLAILVGSAGAGIVVSRLQPAAALAVDALTFVVSAATLAMMRVGRKGHAAQDRESVGNGAAQSIAPANSAFAPDITFWQLARSWRLFQVAFVVLIVGNLTFYGLFEVALPTLAYSILAAGASGYGWLVAAFGGGALIGGLAAGGLGRLRHRGIVMLSLIMALACWYTFMPFAGGLMGAALLIGLAGLTNGLLTVLAFTIVQQQAPRHLLGRIMAVFMVASLGLYPFSVALAGFVTVHFGPVVFFPLSASLMLLAAAFGWSQHEIREL